MAEEVSITVFKGGKEDEGSMRAIDKILEHRVVQICISKKTIVELAKGIMDEDQEPEVGISIRFEYEADDQDIETGLPEGKVIAY